MLWSKTTTKIKMNNNNLNSKKMIPSLSNRRSQRVEIKASRKWTHTERDSWQTKGSKQCLSTHRRTLPNSLPPSGPPRATKTSMSQRSPQENSPISKVESHLLAASKQRWQAKTKKGYTLWEIHNFQYIDKKSLMKCKLENLNSSSWWILQKSFVLIRVKFNQMNQWLREFRSFLSRRQDKDWMWNNMNKSFLKQNFVKRRKESAREMSKSAN